MESRHNKIILKTINNSYKVLIQQSPASILKKYFDVV